MIVIDADKNPNVLSNALCIPVFVVSAKVTVKKQMAKQDKTINYIRIARNIPFKNNFICKIM
jgi:hypothetical protein